MAKVTPVLRNMCMVLTSAADRIEELENLIEELLKEYEILMYCAKKNGEEELVKQTEKLYRKARKILDNG